MCKISVIVPVYNVEKYIDKCIESIKNQTEKDFEVILVDDGSTDCCPQLCDSYVQSDSRFRVIHKKNGGLVSAWMRGLEEAEADYIVFIDSDDWVAARFFEKTWDAVEKYHADMVVCNFRRAVFDRESRSELVISQGVYEGDRLRKKIYPRMLNDGDFQRRGISTSRWGKLIRKNLLTDNLKYCDQKISYSEDLNIIFPVLLDVHRICLLDDPETDYIYRLNPYSILQTYNPTMYEQIVRVYDILFRCINEKNAEFMKNQLYADCLAALVQCYKNELMSSSYKTCICRIQTLSQDKRLRKAVEVVKWNKYRLLNRIIINCLMHWNFFHRNITTRLLYILKRGRIKKMRNKEKRLNFPH